MIENINDFLSVIALVAIVVGTIFGAVKMNRAFKKDDSDDYYRDLL